MIKDIIRSSNYWNLSKPLVNKLGIEAAFLFTNLIEADALMRSEDGWFYQTIETLEEMTTLSRHKQEKAIKRLQRYKLIDVTIKGLPAKRYFKINEDALTEILFEKSQQPSLRKINKLDCEKLTTSKESINKESNYKVYSVFDYWNEKKIIKHRELTHATKSHINARLKKYTEQELTKAIDNYSIVLNNDDYYWTHKWGLQDFMKPNNVARFVDEAKPLENFKDKNKTKKDNRKVADF